MPTPLMLAIALPLLLGLALRFWFLPGYLEVMDAIFFANGVQRYSVSTLSPHWPGYPVYIWIGQLFNLVFNNPVVSLHWVSALAASFITWPLALLTAKIAQPLGLPAVGAAAVAGLLWNLTPISLVYGVQIYSDPLGLLMVAILLYWVWLALEGRGVHWWWAAGALGGVMLGVRLAYLPLLLVLLLPWWRYGWRGLWPMLLAGVLPVVGWLGWQLWMDSPERYWVAMQSHLTGHYTMHGQGGTLLTDDNPAQRPAAFWHTLSVYALGGWHVGAEAVRFPISVLWLTLTAWGLWVLRRSREGLWLTLGLALLYLVVLLVSFDVWVVRYMLPLGMLISLWAALGVVALRPVLGVVAAAVLVGCLAVVSPPLLRDQQAQIHPQERLAYYMAQQAPDQEVRLYFGDTGELPAQFDHALKNFPIKRSQAIVQVFVPRQDVPTELDRKARGDRLFNIVSFAALPPDFPVSVMWEPVLLFERNPYTVFRTTFSPNLQVYRLRP